MTDQLTLWRDQWEAKHQAQISAAARRIGTDAEALAYALKRADRDTLEDFAARLIADESVETKLALSIFTNEVARLEH